MHPCCCFYEVKVKDTQSCLSDPIDYKVHGILQARILEWVDIPFSRRSFQPRDWTQVSHIAGGFFTSWASREAHSSLNFWCLDHEAVLNCQLCTDIIMFCSLWFPMEQKGLFANLLYCRGLDISITWNIAITLFLSVCSTSVLSFRT